MRRMLLLAAAALILFASGTAMSQNRPKREGAAGKIKNLGGKPDHDDHDEGPAGRDAVRIGAGGDGSFREGIDGFDPGLDGWNDGLEPLANPTGADDAGPTRADVAEKDIERLLDGYDRNRERIRAANERETERMRARWRALNEKWRDIAKASQDGNSLQRERWRELLDDVRDPPSTPGSSSSSSNAATPNPPAGTNPNPGTPPTPDPQPGTNSDPDRPPALRPPKPPVVPTTPDGLPSDLAEAGGVDRPGPELPPNAPATPPDDPAIVDPDFAEPERDGTGLRSDLKERADGLTPDGRPKVTVPSTRDGAASDR